MPGHVTVGEYNSPHHLSQDHSLAEIVVLRDDTGELIVIDGFLPLDLGEFDQLPSRAYVQAEVAAQGRLDMVPLRRTELVIGVGELKQKRTGSQLNGLWARWAFWGLGPGGGTHDPPRDERLDCVQHLLEGLLWCCVAPQNTRCRLTSCA